MLLQGQEYLKVGKKEMEKFKKKGYIETGKGNKMRDPDFRCAHASKFIFEKSFISLQ